jgi:hypothetical protein
MPLVLDGGMIEVLTDPVAFERYVANYRAVQRAKKAYYETNKERILARKREKYAEKKKAVAVVVDPVADAAV